MGKKKKKGPKKGGANQHQQQSGQKKYLSKISVMHVRHLGTMPHSVQARRKKKG